MNVENLSKLSPVTIGYRINPDLPVIPFAMDVSNAGCAAGHAHPRGQLIYASRGVMRVICRKDIWVVPPSQAVWIPPNVDHEVYFPGDVSLRNLFVDPSVTSGLPNQCTVIRVSSLLRELILKAVIIGENYKPGSADFRLMTVLLDELSLAEASPLHLPVGRDERLVRVIKALLECPEDKKNLHDWAHYAGASERTLARLFVKETGLTFGEWRKRLILQESIDRLTKGHTVTQVAFDLGYQSISAFIEMFRQSFGYSPGKYILKHK